MSRLDSFLEMLNPGEGGWASRHVAAGELSNVTKRDASEMLQAYQDNTISYGQLLDWANLVLFNDAFEIDDDDLRDCLDRIEESDEPGCELEHEEIEELIGSLAQSV